MKPVALSQTEPSEWDDLIAASEQGWLFHRHFWIGLETRFGGAECLSFGLRQSGRLVAALPLYCSKIGLGAFTETLVHAGLHRHTGLALAPDLSAGDVAAARSTAMNVIREAAQRCDADRIYLAHQNLAPASLGPAREEIPYWATEHGFALGNSFGPGGIAPGPGLATTVVDQIVPLGDPEEALFARLNEACRRAVRKGQRAGLVASELGRDDRAIEEYWRLAKLSAARTGELLPDPSYYATIRDGLAPDGRCDIVFVSSEGAHVAAAILLREKGACHFLAGVSDPAFLPQRVNDVLHWSAILHARQRGDHHYRLGPYFPSVPREWPIETVTRFKSKFGARDFTIVQGSLFLKPQRYRELAREHVARLCEELSK